MTIRHPFQKLCFVPNKGNSRHQLLLAASGPTINCISVTEGSLLHQWPTHHAETDDDDGEWLENGGGPNKKRKLESDGHNPITQQQSDASDASVEIVAERRKGERKKSKFIDLKLPNVSHLLATSDGRHVLAVTAEDKAIRVFRISSEGILVQLSQRSLPKKLCALRLSSDEKTILAADKFGDAYAVPLHPSYDWISKVPSNLETINKPSASESTVHTKRNLDALRQQQDQTIKQSKKEGPDFEHQLLLGHVSLLTDLVLAEGMVAGRRRPFILTSDRDEHIRVSRGLPQSHIIENFCHGHHEFVTKLCIPPTRPNLLVAGDGEPSLRLYEWQTGTLRQALHIGSSIAAMSLGADGGMTENPFLAEGRSYEKLAISGIWSMGYPSRVASEGNEGCLLLVAIEGLPTLMTFTLSSEGLSENTSIKLPGNVLDLFVLTSTQQVVVSIDNVHKPFSMKSYREQHALQAAQAVPLHLLQLHTSDCTIGSGENFVWEIKNVPINEAAILSVLPEAPEIQAEDNHRNRGQGQIFSQLGEFLYGLENLRKKHDQTFEDEEEPEAAGIGDEPKQGAPAET